MSRIRPRQDMHLQAGAAARALALFGVLAACGPSLGADIPRLGDAVTALEAPRPMDALEAAKEIGRLDHRSALALDVRGTAELLMYDLKAAQESFDAARRMQPEDSRSYLGLAACAAAEGRWSTAAAAYERALARECRESAIARTSLAFATLAAGDIQGALDHAREARRAGPCGPLADQVTAMAHFALGRAGQAELALRRSTGATAAPIEAVLSPLHVWPPDAAPPTVLAREPRPMLEEYASADAAMAASPAPSEADLDAPVAIMSPAEGAAVSGTIDVHVGGAARDRVSYVVLLLDGKFRAVRNVTPFRLSLDTMTCGDGAHALKVRGYDNRGGVLGNDEVTVFVNNGARRTVDPSAADPRRQVEQRLERCLALRPHPLNGPYLMGRILDQQNRLADALPAFEYVFSIQPMFPGVRRHLIDVYGRLGVLGGADGARVIRRLPPGGRRVALTFDDGPGPAVTPWILDRLDEVGAKATFFIVGKQAELYPHLVSEIRRRGHELACHSYSHTDLSELSIIEIERELVKTRAIARECTGDFLTYFRPPGGNYDMDVQRAVGEMGYATVFWTAAITDYPGMPPKRILELITGKIDDGGIVLLHNGFDATVDVLPELLSFLKSSDYEFVTLSEGLGATAPSVQLAGGA